MKPRTRSMFRTAPWLAAVPLSMGAMSSVEAEPVDLPLRHLTLYSSGVGYFEHAGAVSGDGEVTLDFTAEQLNDVLKSLLVRGSQGSVAVSYPGQEPIDERLAGFGINLASNSSFAELVIQLRGVPIRVTLVGDPEPVVGRVVNVATRQRVVGEPAAKVTETVVTLATGDGLRPVVLEQAEALVIEDAALQAELDKALSLLGATRDRQSKPVTLSFDQPSELTAVSYLLEMPLWKLSYRLDLSGDEPLIQGWAIVDNTTDQDWESVAVTLVSGRPVSFVQDLYSPEFLKRPVVKPERFAGLRPKAYDAGYGMQGQLFGEDLAEEKLGRGVSPMAPASAPVPALAASEFNFYTESSVPARLGGLSSGVNPTAATGDLGELFAYTIAQPVTLARGGSAMLPIVNAGVEAERVSIYNINTQAKHPMRGVRLTNTTGLKLDAGPVTVIDDGAYAGDAQVGFLAPGDDRLLAYGLDLELTVDAKNEHATQLTTATLNRGVLKLQHSVRHERVYTVRSAAGEDRSLLIEHAKRPGLELKSPASQSSESAAEQTDSVYRFPLEVPAGETVSLEVVEHQPRFETHQLARYSADQVLAYAQDGRFPEKVKEALRQAGALQQAVEQTRRKIASAEQRISEITAEQDRLRRNMGSIDRNSSLYKRYLTKLDEQETTLEELDAQLVEQRKVLEQQERTLADYLERLTLS